MHPSIGTKGFLVIVMAAAVAGAFVGCAPAYVPAVGPTHPASADAPETPPPPPSQTLAGDPVPAPVAATTSQATEHATHSSQGGQPAPDFPEMHGMHGGH